MMLQVLIGPKGDTIENEIWGWNKKPEKRARGRSPKRTNAMSAIE